MPLALFDAHCDTIWRCWADGCSIHSEHLSNCIDRADDYSPYTQVYALWTDKGGYARYQALLAKAKQELKDARNGYLLSIEGAEGIDCDIKKLKQAYDDGVRAINLCWNYDNVLAGSAAGSGIGLMTQGRDFVGACEVIGVIPDMSHISEKAFWDVLEIAKKPVIASHSDSRALCDVPRNLTDDQFRAITAMGGCVGLNFYKGFLGLTENIAAVVAHAEHFLSLGGQKSLGLGSDFDGCDLPEDIQGVQDVGKIYEAMLRQNWPEDLVRDIFYNNFKRVFDEYPGIRKE
jgi:Zn-dependent dipeptidase, microsomal dipeptidase homolog